MLPQSFLACLRVLKSCFTGPSYERFLTLMGGWITCVGKHTVTGVMRGAGVVGQREHSGFHRFFSRGRWEPDDLGLQLMGFALSQVAKTGTVVLVVDDTLARHTGKHIASAGMHRDPLLSTAKQLFCHFGHNWVVLAVVVEVPRWNKSYSLPVLVRLYRPKKLNKKLRREHRKKTELASELLELVSEHFPERKFTVLGDNAYVNRSIFRPLAENMDFVGRGRMDAALYAPAPAYSGVGRPRVRGERLKSPRERRTWWRKQEVQIYGRPATVRIRVFKAVWYRVSHKETLLFVVIRDWPGHANDDVLVSTDLDLSAEQLIELYCKRWSIEETFGSVKSRLGFEDPQNRTERAVERTAPMALWAYTLLLLWYLSWAKPRRKLSLRLAPWYSGKRVPSFADMLATLRRQSWELILSDQAGENGFDKNSIEPLLDALGYA